LIEICHLGDQIGIFFIEKTLILSENEERKFFFILAGIGVASMFKLCIPNERLLMIYSFVIEIAELIAYILVLQGSLGLYVIAVTFFILELVLHFVILIIFIIKKRDIDEVNFLEPNLIVQWSIFLSSLHPITTWFLYPESRFRQTYYEFIVVLVLFTAASQKGLFSQFIKSWLDPHEENRSTSDIEGAIRFYYYWDFVIGMLFYVSNFLIMPISVLILASLEVHEHGKNLPTYDFVIYIINLITAPLVIIFTGCCCCCLIVVSVLKELNA
jgi:hypothetical protein